MGPDRPTSGDFSKISSGYGTRATSSGARSASASASGWSIPGTRSAAGLPEYFEIPHRRDGTGERFDIPQPDQLVFISWFQGGEVFRSGCCFHRGAGKIFYFRPGHETLPIYYQDEVQKVITNAVRWAAPSGGPQVTFGNYKPLEEVEPQEI